MLKWPRSCKYEVKKVNVVGNDRVDSQLYLSSSSRLKGHEKSRRLRGRKPKKTFRSNKDLSKAVYQILSSAGMRDDPARTSVPTRRLSSDGSQRRGAPRSSTATSTHYNHSFGP